MITLDTTGRRSVVVNFTVLPSNSGTVKCTVWSAYDPSFGTYPERKNSSHPLTVESPPTVRQLLVHPSSHIEGDSVNVSCIFDRGHPEREVSDPRPVGILRGQPRAVPAPSGRLRLSWVWKVSRGENGAEVGCRLDNGSNKKQRLVVVYAPRITIPLPSGEVEVGSLLRCVADANPPARARLQRLDGTDLVSGMNEVEYRLALETEEGRWAVLCIAENSLGQDRKASSFTVKKLPLPVRLDIGESTLNAKERRNISCRPEPADDELSYLQLSFSTHDVNVHRLKDNDPTFRSKDVSWTAASPFPFTTYTDDTGVTVLRPSSGQDLRVTLTPTPRHDGSNVTCRAASEANKGKKGEVTKTIRVHWPPSIRSVSVHGSDGPRYPVTVHKPATIRCELQKGGDGIASVSATVGGRDIGAAQSVSDLTKDEDGYQWTAAVWRQEFKREDKGISVVCRIEGGEEKSVTVDVQWKPRSLVFSPAHETFGGESVNCSADGNPQPEIRMEGFGKTTRGVSAASLAVPATAKGEYQVKCTAENSIGTESKAASITVQKGLPIDFSVSQVNQDLGSTVSLRCGPRSTKVSVSSVKLIFAGGQHVLWKNGAVKDAHRCVVGHEFNDINKSLSVDVRAAPFMNGTVICRLESDDFNVGVEERQIELRWTRQLRRLLTRIENRAKGGRMIEGDTLSVTCEVEVGSPPTKKENVHFSGFQMNGRRTIGADHYDGGWTLRYVSTQVRLSWRHDGETIGCSLGGKTKSKRLEVEYAPRNLSIAPRSVQPGQAVRCSAVGRPTPTVSIRLMIPQLGWKLKPGDGAAELVVGETEEAGKYSVVCEAENVHSRNSTKAVVTVRRLNLLAIMLGAAGGVGWLLFIVVIVVWKMQWRTSENRNVEVDNVVDSIEMISNIYNTEEGNDRTSTSANIPRQSDHPDSSIHPGHGNACAEISRPTPPTSANISKQCGLPGQENVYEEMSLLPQS